MAAASDNVVVDLSNYKDRVGARVAPGRYRVQVEDVEASQSNNGNPMVNLWFRIVGGEFNGQTIVDRLTITEKSLFRVVGFMQAIGLPTPKKRLNLNIRAFNGKTLDIDVADGEPYNGRVKSEVKGYIRVAGAAVAAEGADEFDEFAAAAQEAAPAAPEVPETDPKAIELPEPTPAPAPAAAAPAAASVPEPTSQPGESAQAPAGLDMPESGLDLNNIEL